MAVEDQLVHAARAQSGANGVSNGLAGVDVADQLALALTGVSALAQEDDLRLHHVGHGEARRFEASCIVSQVNSTISLLDSRAEFGFEVSRGRALPGV